MAAMTLTKTFEKYLAANPQIRSPRTLRAYRQLLTNFSEFLGREATVCDLNDETAGLWFRHRAQEVGANTVNSEGASLLAFWKWCARKRLCDYPDIKPPQRVRRRPRALTAEDVAKLFAAAYSTQRVVYGVPGNILWPACCGLFLETAERTGAVLGLEWEHIDLSRKFVIYPAEARKFGTDEIVHRLSGVMVRDLKNLKEVCPEKPFGAVRHTRFYAPWHCLCAEAGIVEKVTPKTIRKTVASHLPTLEDARKMLGHRSGTTTATYYRDETIRDDGVMTELLARLRNPKPKRKWFGWAG